MPDHDGTTVALAFTTREFDGRVVKQFLMLDTGTGEPRSEPVDVPGTRRPASATPEEHIASSWLTDVTNTAWLRRPAPDSDEPFQGFALSDGEHLWDADVPAGCGSPDSGAAAPDTFMVLMECARDDGWYTRVLALDDSSGEEFWSRDLPHTASSMRVSEDGDIAQVLSSVVNPDRRVTFLDTGDGTVVDGDLPGFDGPQLTVENEDAELLEDVRVHVHQTAPADGRTVLTTNVRHGEPTVTYQRVPVDGGEPQTAEADIGGETYRSADEAGFGFPTHRIGPTLALSDSAVGVMSGEDHPTRPDPNADARVVVAPWDSSAENSTISLDGDANDDTPDCDYAPSDLVPAPGAVVLSGCKANGDPRIIGLQ